MTNWKLEFKDDEKIPSYGHWRCPSCSSEFYGGGEPLHKSDCPTPTYRDCLFVFGPKALRADSDALLPRGLTRDDLRRFAAK